MKYEITKEFVFDSAHQLCCKDKSGYIKSKKSKDIFGKCFKFHGHTYHLFITVGSNQLKNGMVINFVELKEIVNHFLLEDLDHTFLNDVEWLKNKETTCENMAEKIFHRLDLCLPTGVDLVEIKLYETPTSCCTYRGEDKA